MLKLKGEKLKNITELLSIKYPLIQGGMANVSRHELVAAVSNAGGLGLIGAGGNDSEWVRNEIRQCKKLTDKPFGVNIMLMSPHACDIAKVVTEEKVKVVTTGAGNPGQFIKEWKEAGIVVIPVVSSVALAKRMERSGVDAVIAEGMEAGGHIGETTTMALIPQIVDAVNIPVIAAGGIADKRQVLATFALGAKGVQVGTVFLASEECPIHINYKNMIIEAKDISTMITGREKNAPVRVLKNKMAREYVNLSKSVENREELEKMTLGSHRIAVFEGDLERGSFMAGQVAGMVKEIKPVKQIIEELFMGINEYKNNLEIL
ncbi:MAG: enoyl-[acyl-carrier-protein] reductase FabK [Clostridia bacterium]|nr:enoyl-[acyl-carrier-protein] reductase FabK [Clostridia bacterium]